MKDLKDQVLIKLAHELAAPGIYPAGTFKGCFEMAKDLGGGDFYDYLVEKE
ncbi:MAG: hypothetical protein OS130_11095 [Thermodesulfobacteriota bacterium]|jgi:hypothetical protein|nr:MAG: hypothetical protein OS130_11095 [Thermodesulfobacteriota bacterium]